MGKGGLRVKGGRLFRRTSQVPWGPPLAVWGPLTIGGLSGHPHGDKHSHGPVRRHRSPACAGPSFLSNKPCLSLTRPAAL